MARQDNSSRAVGVALTIVAVALVVVAIVRLSGDGSESAVVLPTVELVGSDDTLLSTNDFIGQPVVINFWYSACPPCANELQHFAAVDARYGDEVRFVGVNAIDTVEEMTDFAGARGVEYELYQDRLAELQTELRVTSFPTTIFVDSDGTITSRAGVLDEDGLVEELSALIEADQRG